MPRPGQWRLTDLQRLFLALAVLTAVFLSAMALGKRDIALLLVALLLLVVAGVSVFLLGVWYSSKRQVPGGTAYVISSSPPPAGSIVGRCDMRLLIDLPDGGTKMIKLRDPSVSVTKWPRPGMVLPFEVDERNPRVMRVRWDRVDPNQSHGGEDHLVDSAPFHTEYTEAVVDGEIGPDDRYAGHTPPARPAQPVQTPLIVETRPSYTPAFLDPAMDLVEPDVDFSAAPIDEPFQTPLADELSPPAADIEAEPIEKVPGDGEDRAFAADYELPVRGIPQPRPSEPQHLAPAENGSAPRPGMGIMLLVADLNRSLGFYQDTLGFDLVDHASDQVVLAYGGGRLVLRPQADMSPVDRRVIHLHIEVPDVEAAYQELRAKGVEFAHKPRVLSRGDKLELWAARFRDPDQHGIALTQWRDRQDAPRS